MRNYSITSAEEPPTPDDPSNRDTIQDGVNEMLVPAEDPEALARTISKLKADSELRASGLRPGAGPARDTL